jgi:transcriptional regulator with XRE-family HTH domain
VPAPSSRQLGAAIRQIRQDRDQSLEDLAANAGIHWTYLSEIEMGKRNPTWMVVGALAEALDVEIADLAKLAAHL